MGINLAHVSPLMQGPVSRPSPYAQLPPTGSLPLLFDLPLSDAVPSLYLVAESVLPVFGLRSCLLAWMWVCSCKRGVG